MCRIVEFCCFIRNFPQTCESQVIGVAVTFFSRIPDVSHSNLGQIIGFLTEIFYDYAEYLHVNTRYCAEIGHGRLRYWTREF
jgi:hypothetical protein